MKFNKWTLGLAAVGVVSLTSAAYADETKVSQVNTAVAGTTLSGYVDVGAEFTPNGNGFNGPNYNFGNKGNSINLNVVDITLDKAEGAEAWAAGYHAELWIGPDAAALGTTALTSRSFSSSSSTGTNSVSTFTSTTTTANALAAIRQAYVTLNTPIGNGIDWKLGVWDTIIGYESTSSGNNPNYSRSFGYNLEPTTHTGLLGTYKVSDLVTVQLGVADTSYAGGGAYTAVMNTGLYHPTILGAATFTLPDGAGFAKGATISVGYINTSDSTGIGGATSYYAGFTLPTPVAQLKLGGAFDYFNGHDGNNGNAWNMALYGTVAVNDKLSLNLRGEYLNVIGAAGQSEITATVQYSLWANVLTRLEVRWDHSAPGNTYFSNTGNGQQNAFLLAAQAIYTF